MCRGVTRLDEDWGKKQVWRPHVRLVEANVLHWRKCLWHCCDFLAPRSDSASGELCPLPLSLRPWWCAIKIGKFSENKQIFTTERHEVLFHEHLQFWTQYAMALQLHTLPRRLLTPFHVSSCSFCVTSFPAPRVFRRGPVSVLLIIKLFRHSTGYLFKVR